QPIGFTPTEFVCDPEGRIADAFGIKPGQGGGLPAAFLWSWQGELLVRGGHVDAVRKKLPEALRSFPTVAVDAAKAPGMAAESLAQLIRAELSADGRFQVEPSKATLKKLKGYLKRSQTDPRYSDKSRCELGMQVSPNTLVKASVIAGRLTVGAYSVESGCQIGSGSSRWSAKRSTVAVGQAIDDLLSTLVRKRPEMPSSGKNAERNPQPSETRPSAPKPASLSGGEATPALGRLIVEGTPKGAFLDITGPDGKAQSGRLPFQARLPPGEWKIEARAEGYEVWRRAVRITVDRTSLVTVTMAKPGTLEVVGTPAGAEVQITGPGGISGTRGLPVTVADARTGEYRIRVSRPGYQSYDGTAVVVSGEQKRVTVALKRVDTAEAPAAIPSETRSTPKPAPERISLDCDPEVFLGKWKMTTRVFRARDASAVGLNGLYDVEFTGSGCELDMKVTEVGFLGAGQIRLIPSAQQKRGLARVLVQNQLKTLGQHSVKDAVIANLDLVKPDGSGLESVEFILWKGTLGLQGVWAAKNASWAKSEMVGSAVAMQTLLHPPHLITGTMHCAAQCSLHCDALGGTRINANRERVRGCLDWCEKQWFTPIIRQCRAPYL
ncbi:MAG: carboxypeptidase regulatory-like domain-containing protein, partial [Myxococcota bacterium]|nr:carboxypeptidase regulatory-like domain-containing protein [Myxococcota bacterium]